MNDTWTPDEHGDERPSNHSSNPHFEDVLAARIDRRGVLRGGLAAAIGGLFSTTIIGVVPPPTDINMTYTSATIDQFATSDPNANYTYNEEFNDLITKAETATDEAEYEQLMAQANRLLQEDAVIIAFASRYSVGIMSKDLTGWEGRFYSPGELSYSFTTVSWK